MFLIIFFCFIKYIKYWIILINVLIYFIFCKKKFEMFVIKLDK